MRAEELMIGDWVKVNDVEHTHPLQVTEIFKKSGTLYATLYWDGMPGNKIPDVLSADIDKILPIPLTVEILEKNDFSYCESDGGCYGYFEESYSNQTMEIILFNVNSEYRNVQIHIDDPNEPNDVMLHLMECNYVHKLQHILKDCGIKKEIKL